MLPNYFACCATQGKPVGTPDAGAFFRVISQHKVASMFTAPTAIRIIRSEVQQSSRLNITIVRVNPGTHGV